MLASFTVWLENNVKKKQIFLLAAAYAAITAIMSLLFIPAILRNTAGFNIFDLKALGYNLNYAVSFIKAIGADGRNVYLKAQLPLDMLYPVVYGLLYFALANKAFNRLNVPVFASILILCVSDYIENVFTYFMLLSQNLSAGIVAAASFFTVVKTVFLYITVLSIACGALYRFIEKRKHK